MKKVLENEKLVHILNIRVSESLRKGLEVEAKKRASTVHQLARFWLDERLKQENKLTNSEK